MSKTRRREKTETTEDSVSYSRDPISDATLPSPTRRPAIEVTSPVANVHPTREELGHESLVPSESTGPGTRTVAESPERRTQRFRDLRLVVHVGGVMACIVCHFAPYQCICCNGLKCRCTVAGVYRHWENGVPCASYDEQRLLEDVAL